MKKTLLAVSLLATMTVAGAETLRVGSEGAYPPWNYIDEDSGKLAGFEIDLGNAICEKIGYECEFVQNEWDSIIPNLIGGNYDVIMAGMSITDERKETIDFSQEYFPPDPSTYASPVGSEYDFDNLSGVKIGVQGATIQAAYLEENLSEGNQILAYENPDQSVADLMAGNIDLLFADSTFIAPIADSVDDIAIIGPEVMIGGGVGAGMRKEDDDLEAKINEALTALKAEGVVDQLIADYFEKGPFFSE